MFRNAFLIVAVVCLPALASCDSPTEITAAPSQQVPLHTHDASDIVSGLLNDGLFSPTIRIIDRDTVRFGGVLAWGGGSVLESSSDRLSASNRLEALEAKVADLETHTHDAADITSGTLPDTRLSGNIPHLDAPLLQFGGAIGWGGGPVLASSANLGSGGPSSSTDITNTTNVFTQPQTFFNGEMVATFTGKPTEGSGTVGLRFERNTATAQRPLGLTWTMSGAERWALGVDEGAESFPDFVLLYNTDVGDIFRVADKAHFQMGAGVGPTPTEHLLFLNDRPGSGNENVLNMQSYSNADRFIRTQDEGGGIPFAVGTNGAVGIGKDRPTQTGLMLDVVGDARAESWETFSDARLKMNIQPLTNVLERLAVLQAVQFQWKESGKQDIGVLAQDVEKVFPELVSERDGMKSVDYSGLTAVVLQAIAELAAQCAPPERAAGGG